MKKEYITKNEEETIELGEEFAKKLKPQDVVFLTGNLGAGKTTFVKGVALGLKSKSRVISPTFVLVRSHKVSLHGIEKLYHVDLYRIENKGEIKSIDMQRIFDEEKSVALIEWPEKGDIHFSKKIYKIVFEDKYDDTRKIIISYE